jgi:hypothetical protein
VLRVDIHLNSSESDANYTLTEVSGYKIMDVILGRELSQWTADILGIPNNSVRNLKPGDLGWTIVNDPYRPVLLWEPCFISNHEGAFMARGVETLANILADSVTEWITQGKVDDGIVAIVAGHAHKGTADRGANDIVGGSEADHTERIARRVVELLNEEERSDEGMFLVQTEQPLKSYDKSKHGPHWYANGFFSGYNDYGEWHIYIVVSTDADEQTTDLEVHQTDDTKVGNIWDINDIGNQPVVVGPIGVGNTRFKFRNKGPTPVLIAVKQERA